MATSSTPAEGRRRPDWGRVVALAWIGAAVGFTVVIGPRLGLRGQAWMLTHHVVCAIAAGHELWRARDRDRHRG